MELTAQVAGRSTVALRPYEDSYFLAAADLAAASAYFF